MDDALSDLRQGVHRPPSVGGQHLQAVGGAEFLDLTNGGAEPLGYVLVSRGDEKPAWSHRGVEWIRVSNAPDVVEDEQRGRAPGEQLRQLGLSLPDGPDLQSLAGDCLGEVALPD